MSREVTLKCFEAIGYPTKVLMLDFESFWSSTCGFGCQSTIEYVTDPRWEFLGCGFQWMSDADDPWHPVDEPWFVDGPDLESFFRGLQEAYGEDLEHITIVAKNCKFDITAMQYHFGILPRYTVDEDDLLRFYDARMEHHLKDVCKMLKFPPKGKTESFKDMHFDEIKADPAKYKNLVDYTINDIERQVQVLDWVLPKVDFTEHEAFMARHTLELFIFPRFEVDYARAFTVQTGMELQLAKATCKFDKKMLNSDIQLTRAMGELLAEYDEKVPLKPKGKNKKTGKQSVATKNMLPMLEQYGQPINGVGLQHSGPQFAKDDDGCKWLQAHQDERVRELIEARIGMKSWPSHIGKVKGIVKQSKCNESKLLRVPIVYYGAHTGRWTGNEAINLLNMGSGGRGRKQHPIIGQTRGILKAPKGRVLCIVDSAQIEARKLAWLAGQADLLDLFAEDADPYSDLATDIFQTEVWKWSDDDLAELSRFPNMTEKEFKKLKGLIKLYRGFGKDAILGCGYGMGWATFLARCLQNPFLRPYFDSGEYDSEFVQKIIKTYRRKYRNITKFWKRVETAFKVATKFKGQKVRVQIPNSPSHLGFYHQGGATFIKLPSGRRLRYRGAHVGKDGNIRWRWGHLWGGVITENIDQASSRDLMTFWIQTAEQDGDYDFRVDLHCYDEIVADVPESHGQDHLERMSDIMCTCPDWAYGMPLGAEGCLSDRYKK